VKGKDAGVRRYDKNDIVNLMKIRLLACIQKQVSRNQNFTVLKYDSLREKNTLYGAGSLLGS
jgi:hypothetical protein